MRGGTCRTRDYTLTAVRRALEELLVHFPVYRIYAGIGGISETDAAVLATAMQGARRSVRAADLPLLELIGGWLSGEGLREAAPGPRRHERLRAMVRFQQLSSPTAAKSVEDTAFYRYGRLLSRNEVGSEPSRFALSAAAFHTANRERRRRYPRALLATATHDHKRGEDTRVRLAVLSEIPDEWESALGRWMRVSGPHEAGDREPSRPGRSRRDHAVPDDRRRMAARASRPKTPKSLVAFRDRIAAWQEKALREAKRHTSWAAPNAEYEAASRDFLTRLLDPGHPSGMAQELAEFAARIAPAGALNGLAQTLLRIACPGVPDLYQGAEFWDFSLVDPDNRRPVDFATRAATLAGNSPPDELLESWQDGRVKQAVIARALALRRRASGLFASGTYTPLTTEGKMADHVFGFARIHEGRAAIVIVTRLAAKLEGLREKPLVSGSAWQGTATILPRNLHGSSTERCTGRAEQYGGSGGPPAPCRPSGETPVALLEAQ